MTWPKTSQTFQRPTLETIYGTNSSINILMLLTYLEQISISQNNFMHWKMHGTIPVLEELQPTLIELLEKEVT